MTLTVAFPLPDIDPDFANLEMDKVALGEEFETTVDGVAVPMQAEREAFLKGKDITPQLAALGLPPNPEEVSSKLNAMPKGEKDRVIRVLRRQAFYSEPEGETQWTYRRRFYRTQLFPAGKRVVVTHRYRPSVGSTLSIPVYDYGPSDTDSREQRARYCIDKDIANTVKAKEKSGFTVITLYINYILSSGANWAGSKIGDFRLIVDKGSPDNYVAFCGTGIRKISATQFEMRKTDFVPTGELDIVIFEGTKSP